MKKKTTPARKRPAKDQPTAKKNPAAVALGRLGGTKSKRLAKLSPEERKEFSRKGAIARWAKWRLEREESKSTARI